ncbi:MAG: pseudaminic acid synthase [Gammaproteobacteria bacterium]|nr:pseudaminic acid synthase [Gammaproteobacteria bacterium]
MNDISIDGRPIGLQHPPYVIAELSANHNGQLQKALDTISAAKACGADAIKLQTYTADTMTIDCDLPDFQIKGGPWDGYKLYDLYQWAQTPFEWHKPLFDHARRIGITTFSTPFDESAVDLLEDLNAPAYKIASFEATDLPLIAYAASTGKPLIISTGMADADEIGEAVTTARDAGCRELILLHCISSYPAPTEQSNLRTLTDIRQRFGVETGLSDHTLGNTTAIAAIALGASMIEKHFTLDRGDKGPDSAFSIEPTQLTALCSDCKDAWLALGSAGYERRVAEQDSLRFRRSLYFVEDMKAGQTINASQVRRIRPGYGLAPKYQPKVIGKTVKRDTVAGTPVSWELLDD